jgi:hypothetical protein
MFFGPRKTHKKTAQTVRSFEKTPFFENRTKSGGNFGKFPEILSDEIFPKICVFQVSSRKQPKIGEKSRKNFAQISRENFRKFSEI